MRFEAGMARAMAGITVAQLNHWRYIGLVWPSQPAAGSGHPALYDEEDIAWLKLVKELTELGVAPHRILQAARAEGVATFALHLREAAARLVGEYPIWLDSFNPLDLSELQA